MSIENDFALISDFDKNYCLQVFAPLPVAFTKGKGSYLYDTEGNKYLDMIGGIAVNSLGHGNPNKAGEESHSLQQLLLYPPAFRTCLQALQGKLCRQGILLQFRRGGK